MNVKRIAKVLEDTDDLKIKSIILAEAEKKDQILYGTRSLNRQLPTYLKRKTHDYDILTKKPKKSASELAKRLQRHTRKKVTVVKARHKGTYKVKIDGKTIVDYTQLKRKPKTKKSWGNSFKDINSMKKSLSRSANKKGNEFRRKKDLDAIQRIKISEKSFNF